ncbi:MAG: heavy-metal-associated domain-containing protein [Anaerolineales bacterium]|nr:heavy-metal-associated domain-containing protein [Anaerolineales bacterium]MCX7756550.1 heavy-metal-associated domain-containing protein [Anaerolineales bacterium]MDW8279376.1 heavy-metal-associated domain-containing protein [Anaerolineales bacterium]
MNTVKYSIPNISCGHCVHTIQTELIELEGVTDVRASAETKSVVVTFEPPADEEKIKALLAEINYPVAGLAL